MKSLKELFEQLFSKDRRRADRKTSPNMAVHYWNGGAPTEHSIRDISSTGLFLLTEERWYPGTLLMMTLQRKDQTENSSERSIAVQSRAVRWGSDGVGMEFILLDRRDPRRGQNVLEEGVDRKALEKFLEGFRGDNGVAIIHPTVALSPNEHRHRKGERGAALVEFALIVPIFFMIVFGMCSFGLLFNQYLELTEAVNIGGQQLALARGNLSDPCKTVSGYVEQAAPLLSSGNMAFTFTINGSSYSAAKGIAPTCSSLSSTATKGGYPVSLTVSYACAGVVAFIYTPLAASNCSLQSQITEISQ
jgi:Flp pilus assembly protein TadG